MSKKALNSRAVKIKTGRLQFIKLQRTNRTLKEPSRMV